MRYGIFGLVGPAIAYASIFLSISLTPSFDWSTGALSDLGIGDAAVIFNAGMVTAGALVFVFSIRLLSAMGKRLQGKAGCILIMLSSANLALTGIFTENSEPLHMVVSSLFFLLAILGSFLVGLEFIYKKEKRLGATIIVCSIISAAAYISPIPFAFQELFSSLAIFTWIALLSAN